MTGEELKIVTDDALMDKCNKNQMWVDYKNIPQVVDIGCRIFIDDGLISVIVKEKGNLIN